MKEKTNGEIFNEAMSLIDDMLTSDRYSSEEKKNSRIIEAIDDKFKYELDIKEIFRILSDKTLSNYIDSRRNYFAYKYIQSHAYIDENLASIADRFGYCDQSKMCKDFHECFGRISPKTVSIRGKNSIIQIPDNRMTLGKLCEGNTYSHQTLVDKAFEVLEQEYPSQKAAKYFLSLLEEIDYYKKEYGFDDKVADLIATLAEALEIPISMPFECIFNIWIETENDKANFAYYTEAAFDLEYPLSKEDIKAIKEKYDYEEYEIDDYVFIAYKYNVTVDQLLSICEAENCGSLDVTEEMIKKYKGVSNL